MLLLYHCCPYVLTAKAGHIPKPELSQWFWRKNPGRLLADRAPRFNFTGHHWSKPSGVFHSWVKELRKTVLIMSLSAGSHSYPWCTTLALPVSICTPLLYFKYEPSLKSIPCTYLRDISSVLNWLFWFIPCDCGACLANGPLVLQQDSFPCMIVHLCMWFPDLKFLPNKPVFLFLFFFQGQILRSSSAFKHIVKAIISVKWNVVIIYERCTG